MRVFWHVTWPYLLLLAAFVALITIGPTVAWLRTHNPQHRIYLIEGEGITCIPVSEYRGHWLSGDCLCVKTTHGVIEVLAVRNEYAIEKIAELQAAGVIRAAAQ